MIFNPFEITENVLLLPNFQNLLGTDALGRDILSRLLLGTINSVLIAFISILLATIIGIIIGSIAGYYGGIFELIIQLLIDTILSIPSILIAIAIVVLFESSLISLILAIILIYLPIITNHTKVLYKNEKVKDYIIANKSYGVSDFRIIKKHIFLNIKEFLKLNFLLNFSKAILTEASLGFLGVGIDPSIPTLGNMLNESKSYFLTNPFFTLAPGIMICIIVYSVNSKKKEFDYGKRQKKIRN